MKNKIKIIIKLILKKLKLWREERKEMASFNKIQLKHDLQISKLSGKAVMIGCGIMGRHLARTIKEMPNWELTAVYDRNEDTAQRLKVEVAQETTVCFSAEELFQQLPEDGILIIASTAVSHVELAQKAFNFGIKKIFLEKPVATNLAEAQDLILQASKAKAEVNVDHVRRWIAPLEGLKRLLKTNIIGEVHSLYYNFGRAGFAMIGTHLFDLTRWLFDSEIVKIRGQLDHKERINIRGAQFIDPSGKCEYFLKNGIQVILDLSDNMPLQQDCFTIYGQKGRVEVDQRIGNIRLIGSAGRIYEEHFPWHTSFYNGLALSLFELRKGVPARCSLNDGMKALEATIAVHLSDRQGGQWVTFPLQGEIVNETFPFA